LIPSPFGWITGDARAYVLAVLTGLLVGLSVALWDLGQELVTSEAPHGIVSFELAGSVERSSAIIDSWSPHARAIAMLIQGLDSLFLLVYPAWLSMAAVRLGTRLGGRWAQPGLLVSWLVLGSAPLDAVENHALVEQLMHGPSPLYAQLAWLCAAPKFVLVAGAAAFLLLASCTRLLVRSRAP